MKITLQTLHSNQLCDPIEPLPPLESEPIATLSQGLQNPYTLLQPMRQLQLHLLDLHQGHHKTPMQWTSMRLKDEAQIQWCATGVGRLVTPDPTARRHSMFTP